MNLKGRSEARIELETERNEVEVRNGENEGTRRSRSDEEIILPPPTHTFCNKNIYIFRAVKALSYVNKIKVILFLQRSAERVVIKFYSYVFI